MDKETLFKMSKEELVELLHPLLVKQQRYQEKINSDEHKLYRQIKNRECYLRRKARQNAISVNLNCVNT